MSVLPEGRGSLGQQLDPSGIPKEKQAGSRRRQRRRKRKMDQNRSGGSTYQQSQRGRKYRKYVSRCGLAAKSGESIFMRHRRTIFINSYHDKRATVLLFFRRIFLSLSGILLRLVSDIFIKLIENFNISNVVPNYVFDTISLSMNVILRKCFARING